MPERETFIPTPEREISREEEIKRLIDEYKRFRDTTMDNGRHRRRNRRGID